jgi:hypothetical protein
MALVTLALVTALPLPLLCLCERESSVCEYTVCSATGVTAATADATDYTGTRQLLLLLLLY